MRCLDKCCYVLQRVATCCYVLLRVATCFVRDSRAIIKCAQVLEGWRIGDGCVHGWRNGMCEWQVERKEAEEERTIRKKLAKDDFDADKVRSWRALLDCPRPRLIAAPCRAIAAPIDRRHRPGGVTGTRRAGPCAGLPVLACLRCRLKRPGSTRRTSRICTGKRLPSAGRIDWRVRKALPTTDAGGV